MVIPVHRCVHEKIGFTLVEISIVMVIIGLLVGGVLVGRDLIQASYVRKQASALGRYDSATMAFRLKYKAIPGDIGPVNAAAFGFNTRTAGLATRYDNGYVGSFFATDGTSLGVQDFGVYNTGHNAGGEESQLFWADLARANLIADITPQTDVSMANYDLVLPTSILGKGHVLASSGSHTLVGSPGFGYFFMGYNKTNTYQYDATYNAPAPEIYPALSSAEAYALDSKLDDGQPTNGKIYTLDRIPFFGVNPVPVKGVMAGCAVDLGGGRSRYDFSSTAEKVCLVKYMGNL